MRITIIRRIYMALERWHPLKDLDTMRRDMDRIWDELFPAKKAFIEFPWKKTAANETAAPAIDVIDNGAEVLVKADMPGVKKEHIDLSFHDGSLTIKGEIREDKEFKDEDYRYSERSYRSYARTISLPFKINTDKITADLKDGVLSVRLPKVEEVQPKKIKVELAGS